MDSQPPEVQVKMIERRVETLETRVTTHGTEIDNLQEKLVRTEERDKHRDEQLSSLGSKIDRMDGKIDLISIQPAKDSAEKWDKAVWIVISGVIAAVLGYVLGNVGL